MGFSEQFFNKSIDNIEIDDLIRFFSLKQYETSTLEFKCGDNNEITLEKIHEEVCAFLNTEGGLIIIGSPKEQTEDSGKNKRKYCIGDLSPANTTHSHENIIRSIAGNISQGPYGIKGNTFNFKNGKVFILDIPQSLNPPHQVNKQGKYFIRLGEESCPAPHGIVEALFYKRQKPDLFIQFQKNWVNHEQRIVDLKIILGNSSIISAKNPGLRVEIIDVDLDPLLSRIYNVSRKGDCIILKEYFSNEIIVDGIPLEKEYRINCKKKYLYVKVRYYCEDVRSETFIFIHDIESSNDIAYFDSKLNKGSLPSENKMDIHYYGLVDHI